MKKIGIMGAQGCGKTTLALKMAASIKCEDPRLNVSILPEVARSAPGPINEGSTAENQLWIHHMQFCNEIKLSMTSDVLVCDRTVLDSLVYSRVLGYNDIIESYLLNAIAWLNTYDMIFWKRPMFDVFDDGVRSANKDFLINTDNVFDQFVREYNIEYK